MLESKGLSVTEIADIENARIKNGMNAAEIEALRLGRDERLRMNKYLKEIHPDTEYQKEDMVNHPSHYINGNRETIDTIKDVTGEEFEGYLVGSVIKYLSRYPYKGNPLQDLKKCQWYINKLIETVDEDKTINK